MPAKNELFYPLNFDPIAGNMKKQFCFISRNKCDGRRLVVVKFNIDVNNGNIEVCVQTKRIIQKAMLLTIFLYSFLNQFWCYL